jgi:hypothetical protein
MLTKMQKIALLVVLYISGSAHAAKWTDNFNGTEPNQAVWTFINPLGDGAVTAGSGALSIAVPGGDNHDPSIPNNAPHLMANIQDVNFTIEVKFTSGPELEYQMQGLLAEQDDNNFIRFDFFSDGSNVRLYAESFTDGSGSTKLNTIIAAGSAYYLRIDRQADQWTLDYSYDGNDWGSAASFSRTMTVGSVGIHAGNYSDSDDAPAFTAVADYFSSTVSPIVREPNAFGLIVNAAGSGKVTKSPDKASYTLGEEVTLTATATGSATFVGWTGDITDSNNPVILTVTGNHVITAVFDSNSHINVWYGDHQVFSQHGTPQRWINILGNVTIPSQIKSLTYSLNGGSHIPLTIDTDNPRLAADGDFNIDIACEDLLVSPTLNTVVITATDLSDNVITESVSCEYRAANSWPLPYDVNWSTVTDISNVVQVVDGQWVLDQNGISTVVQGYDRAFAIGDMNNWRDYEVTVPITVHHSYHLPGQSGNQPAIGLAMRWTGHYQDTNDQPAIGYHPIGASVLFKWSDESSGNYIIYNQDFSIIGESNAPGTLEPEVTYIFKMRVETIPAEGILYSFKVWEDGQSEPNTWLLQREENLSDPANGSILFLAHHVDATFGNISVTNVAPLLTISGHVQKSGGQPVSGVTMNGLPGNPITDSNGFYSATVSAGWTWTVTPAKTGYTFASTSRSYTNVTADANDQDYIATQITFTISGNAGVDGATMSGLPGNPVTSGGGLYTATVPYDWSGTAAPTKTGYTFTPASRPYTSVTSNKTAQNYTANAAQQSLPITLTQLTIKAGKTRALPADSFTIKGTFGATLQDISGSTEIHIRLSNASETIFDGVIPYNSTSLIRGKYSYKRRTGETGNIKSASFDFNTKAFKVAAAGIDLTGLSCPVNVELEWGSYQSDVDAAESLVNTTKPIPMPLLSGYDDAIRIDKATVRVSTTAGTDSLTVKGAIAFASGLENLTQHDLTLHWGAQDFTVPAGGFVPLTNNRYSYASPKGTVVEIKKTSFDILKCTFTFSVKNAAITSQTGTVSCGITYDTFDQSANYTLP